MRWAKFFDIYQKENILVDYSNNYLAIDDMDFVCLKDESSEAVYFTLDHGDTDMEGTGVQEDE